MRVLRTSKQFDFNRLKQDLIILGLPIDFKITILNEINSYWGLYYSGFGVIKSYTYGLSYETAFPHILHEVIHHFQHKHQRGFRRKYGVMHDKSFKLLYESKLNEWVWRCRDRR